MRSIKTIETEIQRLRHRKHTPLIANKAVIEELQIWELHRLEDELAVAKRRSKQCNTPKNKPNKPKDIGTS